MSSPKQADFSDYETMFKRHVHDNLLLNSDLRLLDEMRKSKLREFRRDKVLFKNRFSRYEKAKSVRSLPDGYYTANSTPRATPKPSFIVCKNSPCSLKTWSNMTDITKVGVDVYRTDVLRTEEAEVSFRKKMNKSNSDENVSNISGVQYENRPGQDMLRCHSSVMKSPRIVNLEKAKDEADDNFRLPDFRQRAYTMPSYCCNTKGNVNTKKENTVLVSKTSCEKNQQNLQNNCSTSEHLGRDALRQEQSESDVSTPNIIVTNHSSDRVEKPAGEKLKVTFDEGERDQNIPDQATPALDSKPKFQRAKSMVLQGNNGRPSSMRQRSFTIDSSNNALKDINKLLIKRESLSLNKLNVAARKYGLFEKLISSISSAEDDSVDWSRSFEDVQACRYLRVPGQSIHGSQEDLTLENISFRQDN